MAAWFAIFIFLSRVWWCGAPASAQYDADSEIRRLRAFEAHREALRKQEAHRMAGLPAYLRQKQSNQSKSENERQSFLDEPKTTVSIEEERAREEKFLGRKRHEKKRIRQSEVRWAADKKLAKETLGFSRSQGGIPSPEEEYDLPEKRERVNPLKREELAMRMARLNKAAGIVAGSGGSSSYQSPPPPPPPPPSPDNSGDYSSPPPPPSDFFDSEYPPPPPPSDFDSGPNFDGNNLSSPPSPLGD